MQNVQNAAEIQQRVINLVELYRHKVGKESDIAMAAKADDEYWGKENMKMAEDAFDTGVPFFSEMYPEGPHTEVWIKHLMVNEQLLGHFYVEVVGENSDKAILDQLLPDVYDKTIFSEEEEAFLKDHFKEMVNYIILTPCDDSLGWVHRHDGKDAYTIPKEVLELIKSRVEIAIGSRIFYPSTLFAQLANLFNGCKFYCNSMFYAWTKVAIYANGIDAEPLKVNVIPKSYDAIVSYLPEISEDSKAVKLICEAYTKLPSGGKLVLLCPIGLLAEKDHSSFRGMLVKDMTVKEIIQLPSVMSNNASSGTYCLLIAEKGHSESKVTLIDARVASKENDTKHYLLTFDNVKFNTILQNDGIDPNTGLRKVVKVSCEDLSQDLLVPHVYTVERPTETEYPVPLSSLCSMVSTKVRDVQYDLPKDTPWITMSDLTPLFTGDLDMSSIRKADCPNNPPFVEGSKDYGFNKDGKFIDSIWGQIGKSEGLVVLDYRKCTYLDGNNDVILYERSAESGVQVAVVRATGKPYTVSSGILVFCPKDDFDANSLAALLRMPVVYRQLIAYQEYGLTNHLNDIFVPTDKRIIGDELSRMHREEVSTTELNNNFVAAQKKHTTKLEDYQHAMRKHIREISSSVRRMERFVNDMESSEEIKNYLMERLSVINTHRLYLSDDIERLKEENTYGEASPFDIDHSLRNYREYFGSDVCPIKYTNEIANEAIRQYRKDHQDELKELDEESWTKKMEVVLVKSSLAYVDIAEYNFGKIVRNILENAKKHGFDDFTDVNHKECIIEIVLNWDKERQKYRIDFRNNGNPLPEGLTKESYGENRKYAGKTGGTGIGGYEVAENVRHYDGDYAITQDGDWVVVSIYLPKSKTYGERL